MGNPLICGANDSKKKSCECVSECVREKYREKIKGALKQCDSESDLRPVDPLSPPAVCDITIQNFSSSDGDDKKS